MVQRNCGSLRILWVPVHTSPDANWSLQVAVLTSLCSDASISGSPSRGHGLGTVLTNLVTRVRDAFLEHRGNSAVHTSL